MLPGASVPGRRQTLRVDYVTNGEPARMLLPEPLALPTLPGASIYVTEYFDMFARAPVIRATRAASRFSTAARDA
ncbi:hypothetical protein QE418_001381 [Microbacterium testaceum]|nr:hypothetical protein [Microbacterium testaceum]MDR6097531.1 hypothetical protein [Microbacterium sp. SORGH_AS_0454]